MAEPLRRSSGPRERVSGSRSRPSPLSAAAVESRAGTLAVLASWSGFVATELGVAAPPHEVEPLADFLGHHLRWLSEQETAGELAAEIAGVLQDARLAAGPDGALTELGPCVHHGCATTVTELPDGGAGCSMGHQWGPGQLLLLAHHMRRRTAADAQRTPA